MPDLADASPSSASASAGAARERKQVWNSLEVAKLVIAASTSASVALFGAYFTWYMNSQGAARERAVRTETARREARVRIETAAREAIEKKASLAREEALRRQAAADARVAAELAFRQSKTLNDQRIASERATQKTALSFARAQQNDAKRLEVWQKVYPFLIQLGQGLDRAERAERTLGVRASFHEIDGGSFAERYAYCRDFQRAIDIDDIFAPVADVSLYFSQAVQDKLGYFIDAASSEHDQIKTLCELHGDKPQNPERAGRDARIQLYERMRAETTPQRIALFKELLTLVGRETGLSP